MISEDKNAENRFKNQPHHHPRQSKANNEEDGKGIWGILLFGFMGATVTTIAAGRLRRTIDWFYTQLRSQSFSSRRGATGGSNQSSFNSEGWKGYYRRRMQEEYEEEMERVERIKRMQSVFNRERNKYKRSYESWKEGDHGAYQYQQFQRDDWYWKTDPSYKDRRTNYRATPRDTANYSLSHHYSVLGLDRLRVKPYSDAEIKMAFRAKAMEYHPDQNQDNKEAAETKFKEVMVSYEAIKSERKNGKC